MWGKFPYRICADHGKGLRKTEKRPSSSSLEGAAKSKLQLFIHFFACFSCIPAVYSLYWKEYYFIWLIDLLSSLISLLTNLKSLFSWNSCSHIWSLLMALSSLSPLCFHLHHILHSSSHSWWCYICSSLSFHVLFCLFNYLCIVNSCKFHDNSEFIGWSHF